jgi:hypothetical protein
MKKNRRNSKVESKFCSLVCLEEHNATDQSGCNTNKSRDATRSSSDSHRSSGNSGLSLNTWLRGDCRRGHRCHLGGRRGAVSGRNGSGLGESCGWVNGARNSRPWDGVRASADGACCNISGGVNGALSRSSLRWAVSGGDGSGLGDG